MLRSSGSTSKPLPAGGIHSGLPDTHSIVTRSPDSTVSTGGSAPSRKPQWIVSGVDLRRCVLAVTAAGAFMRFSIARFVGWVERQRNPSNDDRGKHVGGVRSPPPHPPT